MKNLLTAILAIALASFIFTTCRNRSNSSSTPAEDEACDTIVVSEIQEEVIIEDEEETTEAVISEDYYGDTLYQYDGKTIVYNYYYNWDRDQYSIFPSSAIVTYRDTTPIDVCPVAGNGTWFINGDYLDFAIGVDTISYPFRKLPHSVNPEKELLSPKFNVAHHTYFHTFALTDSSDCCGFKFEAYLPKSHPQWLRQFIAIVMRNDIQAIFLDNKGIERLFNTYCGVKKTPTKINGIDARSMTPEQIAKHFASVFETHYKQRFNALHHEAPSFDYALTVAPAWESRDKQLITYRFYSYYYTSGLHGYMEEYYLTFNNKTGQLLGADDLFTANNFKKAIDILEQKLCDHRNTYTTCDGPYPANLEEGELVANASEIIKEVRDSVYYPRPALTNKGVVFSYQPYEKGAFCEGILHFPIPYNQLRLNLKL